MLTIGERDTAGQFQFVKETIERILVAKETTRPDYKWTGHADRPHRSRLTRRQVTKPRLVILAGWQISDNPRFGLLEDGSIYSEGTLTARNPFTGRIRWRRQVVLRLEIYDLNANELRELAGMLALFDFQRLGKEVRSILESRE